MNRAKPSRKPATPTALSRGALLTDLPGLATSLSAQADFTPPEWVHLIPAGTFSGRDGRGPYTLDAQAVHDAYPGAIVNTHPALLPSFKGWHAVDDALAYGVKVTGCTVHLATLEVDEGPILAQEAVPVLDDDTVETLHERIKDVERRLYPRVLRALVMEPQPEEG